MINKAQSNHLYVNKHYRNVNNYLSIITQTFIHSYTQKRSAASELCPKIKIQFQLGPEFCKVHCLDPRFFQVLHQLGPRLLKVIYYLSPEYFFITTIHTLIYIQYHTNIFLTIFKDLRLSMIFDHRYNLSSSSWPMAILI